MTYVAPGEPGSITLFPERYDNFIGGKWVAPLDGEYVQNVTPVNGRPFVKVARSKAARRASAGRRPRRPTVLGPHQHH